MNTMATTQKTVLRRFNGEDWDAVYLANSADITFYGQSFTVTPTKHGFVSGDTVTASDSLADLIQRLINHSAHLDKEVESAAGSGLLVTDELPGDEELATGRLVLTPVKPEAVTSVTVAPLSDQATGETKVEDPAPDDYSVSVSWTGTNVYNVKLTAHGVKEHTNGNQQKGHWVGCCFYAPDGCTSLQRCTAEDLEKLGSEQLTQYAALDKVDGKDCYLIYFDNGKSKTRALKLKWGDAEPIIYTFNLDNVTNADE